MRTVCGLHVTMPAGTGVLVNVTIANGRLPLLQETKPFFSYTGWW
jgi:hypothetical protein